jgi:hypothetical protein
MLRFLFATFVIFVAGFYAPVYAAGCDPSSNEVAFFQHSKYGGICSVLGIGSYASSTQMRVKNDSISSFKVGNNVQVTVCNQAEKGNVNSGPRKCQTFKSSMSSLSRTRVGNDSISSATIRLKQVVLTDYPPGRCNPGENSDSIAVYQHPKLQGNCRILRLGTYENSKIMNFKNDSISSIEFGQNSRVKVILCQHGNFKGRCEELRGTDISLFDNRIGDNSISSIKVIRRF